MFYVIEEILRDCSMEEALSGKAKYVAVLSPSEWEKKRDQFDMGIDMDIELLEAFDTKIEVNYDSLTGTFAIPDRQAVGDKQVGFAFALDEKGIVLIDADGGAAELVKQVQRTKRWRQPCLERFIYDLMETIVAQDRKVLEEYESRLDAIEADVLQDQGEGALEDIRQLNDIRGQLLELRLHYEQLIDIGQELEENENGFFTEENLRFFHLLTVRVERLRDTVIVLREYTLQVRDLYQTQLDVRQNHIMAILTIITTVFTPLTLVTGWYGMNFVHMPELEYSWSYPVVAGLCVLIVVICIIWFKKKKWL